MEESPIENSELNNSDIRDYENDVTSKESSSLEQMFEDSQWKEKEKHIFILSSAGKPVYARYGCEDRLVTLYGVMQALVSVVQDSDDTLQAIHAGKCLVVFLIKGPIILVAVSRTTESVNHINSQLTYVYNQVVSILTLTQVTRIYEQRRNYDLRRLLAGSERLIDHLLTFTESQPEFLMDSVSCLPLPSHVREGIASAIISSCSKIKNLVFAILIADNKLITLVRMKKYSIKPSDLHLVFNMVSASESFKTAESWTPICLPNFDSSGFLHAHVSYLSDDCPACLLLLTVDRDLFFSLSDAKQKIVEKFRKSQYILAINDAFKRSTITMSNINIDKIRHFIYKCRKTSQMFAPAMSTPYHTPEGARELLIQYESIHCSIHKENGPLKLIYQQLMTEVMLGWVTEKFELYVAFEPLIRKSASIDAVNKLLQWIQKEEEKIFIQTIPTF